MVPARIDDSILVGDETNPFPSQVTHYQRSLGKLIVNKPKSRDALIRDSIECRKGLSRQGGLRDVSQLSYSILPEIKVDRDKK